MKRNALTALLLATVTTTLAQQSGQVSIGAGLSRSSSDIKKEAYAGNGFNLQGDVFIPFLSKNRFALGVVAGGSFYTSESLSPDAGSTQAAYKLYNGTLTVTNQQKGASTNNGFTASAGLQASFSLGRVALSPSLSGGYFNLQQDGYTQQATVEGKPIALRESVAAKHSGFITIPQIRISCPLTSQLGIYASSAFL
ncbi:MAG: hypothetical protein JNL59_07880, partial [Chitinophagaceae bacterium]|nr:hypothetical protein [Chitinophagaceae bacterium]